MFHKYTLFFALPIFFFAVLCMAACGSKREYAYEVPVTKAEYKVMKKYASRHRAVLNEIGLRNNSIVSDNRDLLVKIKIRLAGITSPRSRFGTPSIPIVIKYMDSYYHCYDIENMDWLNDEEIIAGKYSGKINITIPEELEILSRDEFLKTYFDLTGDGNYKCNISSRKVLFPSPEEKEQELLFQMVLCLGVAKFGIPITMNGYFPGEYLTMVYN